MSDVYKIVELVGTSTKGIEDAVDNALARASESLKNLGWFQVVETRGSIDKNKVHTWQVILKVGFKLESE